MNIDEENRQWIWEALVKARHEVRAMSASIKAYEERIRLMKLKIYEADNPEDYFCKELKEAALYSKVKRI